MDAGDAIVLFNYQNTGAYTVSDSCNQNWQKLNNTALGTDTWIVLNAAICVTDNITVSRASGQEARFVWVAATYGGVASVGNMVTNISSTNNCAAAVLAYGCTGTVSIQTADNWVVAGIAVNTGTQQSTVVTARTGNLRRGADNLLASMALVDNTSASVGPVSAGINASNSAFAFGTIIELKAAGGAVGGRNATLTDDFQTIILGRTPGDSNYVLPAIKLADTWCVWVMSIDASGTHQLVIQAPALLNGQSSNITLPAWQMLRVCQDANGNYFSPAPLVQGSGITVSPSQEAITISAAGARAGSRRERARPAAVSQRRPAGRITVDATVTCNINAPTPCVATLAPVAIGDTLILALYSGQTYTISDTCNHQWNAKRTASPQIWVGTGGSGSSCAISTARTDGTADAENVWAAIAYSGVASVSTPITANPGCGTTPSNGATLTCSRTFSSQHDGGVVLGVITFNNGTNQSFNMTPLTGTRRAFATSPIRTLGVMENTSPIAGIVTLAFEFGSNVTVFSGAFQMFELEPAPAPPAVPGYFGQPPFIAGPGITLTPGPTGIVISTTPTR